MSLFQEKKSFFGRLSEKISDVYEEYLKLWQMMRYNNNVWRYDMFENIDGQNVDLFKISDNNQQQNQNNQQNNNQQPGATNTPQGQQPESAITKRSRLKKIYDMYSWQK